MWSLESGAIGQPFRGHEKGVSSVTFSPDGQRIASGGWDGTVRLWRLDGDPVGLPFQGHIGVISSVAFSPDGQCLVSGGVDGALRLWRGSWEGWLQAACNRLRYRLYTESN